MKIKEVSRTISFGNYENISMSAEVGEGEFAHVVLQELENIIKEEIEKRNISTSGARIHYDVQNLEHRRDCLKADIESLSDRKAQFVAWFKDNNIPEEKWSSIPF